MRVIARHPKVNSNNSMKKIIIIIGIVIIAIGAIWLATSRSQEKNQSDSQSQWPLQGAETPILGRNHYPEGTRITSYNSNPPTSGNHWPTPANWGIYTEPLPDEALVHNLEHGGIWISYKNIDDDTLSQLQAIAGKYNQAVILTPRPQNDTAIALASWGRLEKLDALDADRIETFIKVSINNSPEPLASLEKTKIARDKLAPDATFTTLDGRELSLSEFRDKKVMFWLLATWCPSCIAGAQVLAENNEQLSGLTIIALETYGNAGYPGPSMEAFAKQNAPAMLSAQNWLWGDASQEATEDYNPRNYPDIYFLIDEDGVLRDIDTAPAATINKIIEFAN